MKYKAIAPPEILKPFVRHFWSLESSGEADNHFTTSADGCPGLIFQHADNGIFYQNGKELPDTFLFGQTTKHAAIDLTGTFRTTGIFFYPHAIKSLFGFDPSALTDTCMDANLLANKQQLHLSEQLANTSCVGQQVEILTTFLCAQIGKNTRVENHSMHYALTEIIQSKGNVPMKLLMDNLKFTERTFERRFKQYVGISPKLFSRICRFQASLQQLRASGFDKLSDIAFENNYADQSHFIRSFKEFAGVSPFQYQKQFQEIVENLAGPVSRTP